MNSVPQNIREITEQVRASAEKANRNPADITIVAVTKTVPVEVIKQAVSAGFTILGENRVQELLEKHGQLEGVKWNLIGHLQTNKVKYIADKVSLIHSLDSVALTSEISKRMVSLERVMDVLVQVNVAKESTKYGIPPEETIDFIREVIKYPGLKVRGLMTIAPYTPNPEEVRPVFKKLKELSEKIKVMDLPGADMRHLSMGMSNDYRVAVEEGATMLRIGSSIFGSRN